MRRSGNNKDKITKSPQPPFDSPLSKGGYRGVKGGRGGIIALCFMLMALCFLLFALPLEAKVTGNCVNCHTMHNSQDGSHMQTGYGSTEGAKDSLLRANGCLGCHATTGSGSTGVGGAPIVYNTTGVGYGANHEMPSKNVGLAAGNFYWTIAASGERRGHSIAGISNDLTGYPGYAPIDDCSNQICHREVGEGCKSCHLPKHHKGGACGNPSVGCWADEADGYYRFLGPIREADGGSNSHNWGLRGYEDDDWQEDNSGHNEYSGEAQVAPYFSISRFCDGCHGEVVDVSPWNYTWGTQCFITATGYPHSLDSLPTPDASGTNNWDGYGCDPTPPGVYNLFFPIARTNISTGAYPSDTIVYDANNLLTCLTCHRAHASPYNHMLRWDNTKLWGDMVYEEGCKFCHNTDPR